VESLTILDSIGLFLFLPRLCACVSASRVNYALLSHDGELTTKGAGFKASDLEPYLAQFLKDGITDLLHGDIEGLRKRFRDIANKLQSRQLTAEHVSKSTRLNKDVAEYQQNHLPAPRASRQAGKFSQPHYEAAIAAGQTDLRAGETVRCYKAEKGWKVLPLAKGESEGVTSPRRRGNQPPSTPPPQEGGSQWHEDIGL
jgi:hypothetical protein